MSAPPSLAPASDYSHRFHAGNHGDVFKHAALLAFIEALARAPEPLLFVETHAGEGRYTLGSTGEWTEGIGRLDAAPPPAPGSPLAPFAAALARASAARRTPNRGGPYPGSPALALGALRPADRAVLYERSPEAASALRRAMAGEVRARVEEGDGLAGLLSQTGPERLLVHIDPPYTDKAEWTQVADALVALLRGRPTAAAMLWYPIKSLTRPNALHAELRRRGVAAEVVELHVTPQDVPRNALHGSGLVLVGAPPGLAGTLAAQGAALGPLLATHAGRWQVRTQGWAGA